MFNFLIRVYSVDLTMREFIKVVILQKVEWINRQLNQSMHIYLKPENIFCTLEAQRLWCLVFISGGFLGSCVCGFFCCLFVLEGFCFICLNMKEGAKPLPIFWLISRPAQTKVGSFEAGCPLLATTLFSKGQDIQRT